MSARRTAVPVKVVGGVFVAFLVWLAARPFVGGAGGALVGVLGGTAGAWRLPHRVLVRVLWTVPLFFLLIFTAVQLMFHVPGDPFASEKNTSPEVRAEQQKHYGIPEKGFAGGCKFFVAYIEKAVVDGYLGPSIKVQGRSVVDLLLPALPVSLALGLLALTIACFLGLLLGVVAGLRPSTWVDYVAMAFAVIGISLPSFVIGSLLILGLSLTLGWLPVAGWGTFAHLLLPAVALALPYAAYVARLARGGTIEVMSEDYIRTARAKGLSEKGVVLKHALRGAIVPVVSFLGPAAAGILTGSFVVETLFGIPGMGRWFVNGAINRDYYVVLGTVLIECGLVVAFNLLVDFGLAWVDPRLRGKT